MSYYKSKNHPFSNEDAFNNRTDFSSVFSNDFNKFSKKFSQNSGMRNGGPRNFYKSPHSDSVANKTHKYTDKGPAKNNEGSSTHHPQSHSPVGDAEYEGCKKLQHTLEVSLKKSFDRYFQRMLLMMEKRRPVDLNSSLPLQRNQEEMQNLVRHSASIISQLARTNLAFLLKFKVERFFWNFFAYEPLNKLKEGLKEMGADTTSPQHNENASTTAQSLFLQWRQIVLKYIDLLLTSYKSILQNDLKSAYGFVYNAPSLDSLLANDSFSSNSGEEDEESTKLCPSLAFWLCLGIGDLLRYRYQVLSISSRDHETTTQQDASQLIYGDSVPWYSMACDFNPQNGHAFNQLAIIFSKNKKLFDALYFFVRALLSSKPFFYSHFSLLQLFANSFEMSKKLSSIQNNATPHHQSLTTEKKLKMENLENLLKENKNEVWCLSNGRSTCNPSTAVIQAIATVAFDPELPSNPTDLKKHFILTFINIHGMLYTNINMEHFENEYQKMLKQFSLLLSPRLSPDSDSPSLSLSSNYIVFSHRSIIQLAVINIFTVVLWQCVCLMHAQKASSVTMQTLANSEMIATKKASISPANALHNLHLALKVLFSFLLIVIDRLDAMLKTTHSFNKASLHNDAKQSFMENEEIGNDFGKLLSFVIVIFDWIICADESTWSLIHPYLLSSKRLNVFPLCSRISTSHHTENHPSRGTGPPSQFSSLLPHLFNTINSIFPETFNFTQKRQYLLHNDIPWVEDQKNHQYKPMTTCAPYGPRWERLFMRTLFLSYENVLAQRKKSVEEVEEDDGGDDSDDDLGAFVILGEEKMLKDFQPITCLPPTSSFLHKKDEENFILLNNYTDHSAPTNALRIQKIKNFGDFLLGCDPTILSFDPVTREYKKAEDSIPGSSHSSFLDGEGKDGVSSKERACNSLSNSHGSAKLKNLEKVVSQDSISNLLSADQLESLVALHLRPLKPLESMHSSQKEQATLTKSFMPPSPHLDKRNQKHMVNRDRLLHHLTSQHSQFTQIYVSPLYIVTDTNALIDHLSAIDAILTHCVPIKFILTVPLVVVEELAGIASKKCTLCSSLDDDVKDCENIKVHCAEKALKYIHNLFALSKNACDKGSSPSKRILAITYLGNFLSSIDFAKEEFRAGQNIINDDIILQCCLNHFESAEPKANWKRFSSANNGNPTIIPRKDTNQSHPSSASSFVKNIYRDMVLFTDDRNMSIKAHALMIPTCAISTFIKWIEKFA